MIYIVFGAPGEGKSYACTSFAIDALNKGRTVFTNYPVRTKSGKSTYKWTPDLVYTDKLIKNAVIIIDEAYRDYSSREYKNFTKDIHTFFATNRHNELEIYLIAQNPSRIDVVIREILNSVILVRKKAIFGKIIGFKLEYFEDFETLGKRFLSKENLYYAHRFLWFNREVSQAYDTHYYGSRSGDPYVGEYWFTPVKHHILDENKLSNLKENIRKHLNTIDSHVDMYIEGGLCTCQMLTVKGLRWLWFNWTSSRTIITWGRRLLIKLLTMPPVKQLNAWRLYSKT